MDLARVSDLVLIIWTESDIIYCKVIENNLKQSKISEDL